MTVLSQAVENARCICGCAPSEVEVVQSHASGSEFVVTFHCGNRAVFPWHQKPVLYGRPRGSW